MNGTVVAVSASATHQVSKEIRPSVCLTAGLGVDGDAHAGVTVQHRSRVARDPSQPNLRQVHLLHSELLDELNQQGFSVAPGDLGENILTRGVDLLGSPKGRRLVFGDGPEATCAVVELTGLRNPCHQLESIQSGLQHAVLDRGENGVLIRKAGVMAIVVRSGTVAPGSLIRIEDPASPWECLAPV